MVNLARLDLETLDRGLATTRHPDRLVSFDLTSGNPQRFLQPQLFLDHRYFFAQGDNHRVAFLTNRNGLIPEAMDRHPFTAHPFAAQRFVDQFLPFLHDLADTDPPCFHLALLTLKCFDYEGDDEGTPAAMTARPLPSLTCGRVEVEGVTALVLSAQCLQGNKHMSPIIELHQDLWRASIQGPYCGLDAAA
jgi:hypothetical protein